MKRTILIVAALVAALVLLSATGCYRQELPANQKVHIGSGGENGSAVADISSVPLNGAQTMEAKVRMGAGELSLESDGAEDALQADFSYSPSTIKPEVGYEVTKAGVGILSVAQPEFNFGDLGDMTNTWKIALAQGVPLDLVVDLGAGTGDLAFEGLDLRNLAMNMGAGDTTLDFSGTWDHNVECAAAGGRRQSHDEVPGGRRRASRDARFRDRRLRGRRRILQGGKRLREPRVRRGHGDDRGHDSARHR